ncbi:MAG: RNA-binding S4 domain-containing protein [Bauldia sp.]
MGETDRQRIDKWLWYARVVKSRSSAQALAMSGHVRVNQEKTHSASKQVKPGDVLTIAVASRVRILRVRGAGERRGPASEARLLFDELTPPQLPSTTTPSPGGSRPTKRDRRTWEDLDSA